MGLTKYGAADKTSLDWLSRLEAIFAAENTQLTVMVANELELTKPFTAAIAEVCLAAGTGHVITARASLNVELPITTQ